MATNDYLPFGTASGANVLTPSAWAADPAQAAGFVNGIADPAQANTAWRQASVPGVMIAQFTADNNTLGNVVDNGNVAFLETQFESALVQYLQGFFLLSITSSTFFVNFSTGNDSWTGTAATNTAGTVGPFKTIQGALNAIAARYLTTGTITVNVADNASYIAYSIPPSNIGAWNIVGNNTSPGNVIVTAASQAVNNGYGAISSGNVTLSGMSFNSFNSNVIANSGFCLLNQSILHAPTNSAPQFCLAAAAAQLNLTGTIGYSGSCAGFGVAQAFGRLVFGSPVNPSTTTPVTLGITGTPAWSVGGISALSQGQVQLTNPGTTITGAATGPRWKDDSLSTIAFAGLGTSYFPGNGAVPTPTNGAIVTA